MDWQVCEFRTLINDLDGSYKTLFENYIKIKSHSKYRKQLTVTNKRDPLKKVKTETTGCTNC